MSAYVLERKLEGALRSVSKTDFCKASEPRSTIVFVCEESLILKVLDGINRIWGGNDFARFRLQLSSKVKLKFAKS